MSIDYEKLREALNHVRAWGAYNLDASKLAFVCDVAESTIPKTKTVDVWLVEGAYRDAEGKWVPFTTTYDNPAEADHRVAYRNKRNSTETCLRVSGPHQREIPR